MMRPRQHETATIGSTGQPGPPDGDCQLFVVPSDPDGEVLNVGAQRILERLNEHFLLAKGLGLEPLTIDERATAMLDAACDGWRFDRRCRDGGVVLDASHPLCLRAQYHHDVLLLEHGLLNHERLSNER